jgi:beta-N-acetylhexosaminidase
MSARAVIFGCGGTTLAAEERRFFAVAEPWGFILFGRNVESPAQLRRLTGALRDSVGRDAPVLIDQEGGRVARLRAPDWREWVPALDECERLPDRELRARAMHLRYRLIAGELRAVGIDVNCAPVLDVVRPETHAVIRNRCYGSDPGEVAVIGRAVADGLLAGGALPVIKHMPGQGRAGLDSHLDLPEVAAGADALAADFAPFRALADLPMAMTAHVVYTALDRQAPATQSARMVRMIREDIGFGGLLMTDDLSMKALRGSFAERAQRALAAGCDVILHCNGAPAEMSEVADATPELAGQGLARAEAALALRAGAVVDDAEALEAEFAALRASAHA